MSLKRTDLARRLALKIESQMKRTPVPTRFAQGSQALDPRARRDEQAAPRLVAFACRLPAPLVNQLREQAVQHPGGINALVAELLQSAVKTPASASEPAPMPAAAPAKKAAVKKAAAKQAPAKKTAAQPVAAKKTTKKKTQP